MIPLVMDIAGRRIGAGSCFIIAEAGVNHNGDIGAALSLIDAAKDAGADAVKFQTFDADRLATSDAPKAAYQVANVGGESQRDMLRRLQLSEDDHRVLMAHCERQGILFLSSPFDELAADLLNGLDLAAFKLPSGETTNLPLLAHVGRMGRPVILSSGMATMSEIAVAIETLVGAGTDRIALLHCVSNYPAAYEDMNLRAMETLRAAFHRPVGLSDHTMGIAVPIAAVALGGCVVEKHFTLDRNQPGPDHKASLEPRELADMVREIRNVEAALGDGRKSPRPSEKPIADVARKSLVAAADLAKGVVLSEAHVRTSRPGTGLVPAMLPHVLGRRLRVHL
ncbi:MAG: N-acetylneuraminate synthase, partial [Alphaproteobacteria bacterium]|nr:N-acetylneuraminate synthase [Alphaproteobacteria bacterium]